MIPSLSLAAIETWMSPRRYRNVDVASAPFTWFGPLHNHASSLARHDWILSLDSDEVLSAPLAEEILSTQLDPGSVYAFPRHNYFNGKLIKGCGWYPDEQVRLYHRGRTRFTDAPVHERVLTPGLKAELFQHTARHDSYDSIGEFLNKMQRYSDLYAVQNRLQKPSSPGTAVRHGLVAFLKSYLLKRGFLDGYEGFVISAYNGQTAYYKYLKLYEANCRATIERKRQPAADPAMRSGSDE